MTVENAEFSEARLAATAVAISGDSGALYDMVSGLMGGGVPFVWILFDFLAPAERDIGARWQSGDYLISEEHAATATVETVVALLAGSFDQPGDGVHVVVAAAEGDEHSLPARMMAAYLLYLGYRATFLGANVLASDLREFLESDSPDAVVLSCAMTNQLVGARATIRASHAAGVPVIVGGRAFGENGEWAVVVGADAWAPHPRDLPEMLDSWRPDIEAAEAAAANPSDELVHLMDLRAAVTAETQRQLAAVRSDRTDPRLTAEISLLLRAVEASMLIGDDRVIIDMIRWQEATLEAHGYDDGRLLADALNVVLSGISPAAEQALSRAISAARPG